MRTGIALGSNLGDRLQHLRDAVEELRALPSLEPPLLVSRVYETAPVDSPRDAGAYYNAVVEFTSHAEPATLLDQLQAVEAKFGRPSKRPRNAPRTIDLDLLYIGNLALRSPDMVIPHPRLHQRAFVLAPLADLRPELVLPGFHEPVGELLSRLGPSPGVQVLPDEL